MPNQQMLFIADTAFIDAATTEKYNFMSVFPREEGDGAYRDNLDNLLQRSKLQSVYYDTLLPELIPIFKAYMPDAGSEVLHFVRPVLVTVTSLFVDRCIRVLHRMRQQQGVNIAVVGVNPMDDALWLSEISGISSTSWCFNQEIIQRIMVALGFKRVPVFEQGDYPEYPDHHPVPNLLFSPQRSKWFWLIGKAIDRYYLFLRRIPGIKARIISTGLGTDEFYATKRGLYGPFGLLRRGGDDVKLEAANKNQKLRDDLLVAVGSIIRPQFELLLAQLDPDVQTHELTRISKAYTRMLIDWFPIGFLEGLSSNLERVAAILDMENSAVLIGSNLTSDQGYFECASARLAGKIVIGVQHSAGHYGYIEDMSIVGQFENSLYDKMVTWGWTYIDPHLPQCETLSLPCPKLSAQPLKSNYLKLAKRTDNTRDVLFLSNLFHRFPHVSTCGQARVDFIDEITKSQEDMMHAIKGAGLTIDHKPYNMKFINLYPEHYHRLEVAGGAGYRLLRSTQKGLSVDLIKSCRIVLWDQIGSGAVECFTSGVPTMIYWKRIYSREGAWARGLIAELERCGVVQTDASELAQEIKTYLADPEGWMANKERRRAIHAFCQKFALTDPRWYEIWKRQLMDWSTVESC